MGLARKLQPSTGYEKILGIDGSHPFKDKVPGAYVEYQARRRKRGRVAYFNFDLAKEMGLIPKAHSHALTDELSETLLEAFAITIINEYDITHQVKIDPEEIKPNRYMATRYLQLQHPNKRGLTSGDGRSIWNGYVKNNGKTWDISSCGTGATCLSPASAIHKKFYKTGDPNVSYGCGYATLSEGMIDVLLSEIMNLNNIATERVLCVVEFPNNFAITVRAGENLLRPSHFFNHLKQEQYQRLKNVTDFFIDRQLANKTWKKIPAGVNRYDFLLDRICETFAKITAQFESEYIFCWLDWDGDNILADGGIIDFGSVRQFGLFHHEYRFDDDERWSTNIKGQRLKARDITQTFAQLVDYLKTGKKKPQRAFANAPILKKFQAMFTEHKRWLLLARTGFTEAQASVLMRANPKLVRQFEEVFSTFERAKSRKGPTRVPDGITWNAIYSMRDILRVLPRQLQAKFDFVTAEKFLGIMRSSYATKKDVAPTFYKKRKAFFFQKYYMAMLAEVGKAMGKSVPEVLESVASRSEIINRYERITGDAVCVISDEIVNLRKSMDSKELHEAIESFVKEQALVPERRAAQRKKRFSKKASKLVSSIQEYLKEYREGL
ncbi:MAG: protein adenylyltransferase SelO family protein [Oligoflexales bacterium]